MVTYVVMVLLGLDITLGWREDIEGADGQIKQRRDMAVSLSHEAMAALLRGFPAFSAPAKPLPVRCGGTSQPPFLPILESVTLKSL